MFCTFLYLPFYLFLVKNDVIYTNIHTHIQLQDIGKQQLSVL